MQIRKAIGLTAFLVMIMLFQNAFVQAQTTYTPKIVTGSNGSVGIGTTTPDGSAILHIFSTSGGLLIPSLTDEERNAIENPATGLLIFNTTTQTFQFNSGTEGEPVWEDILFSQSRGEFGEILVSGGEGEPPTWQDPGEIFGSTAWSIDGNTGTSADENFVGTTDEQDMVVRTNSIERMRVSADGDVGIGTATPGVRADVDGGLAIRPAIVIAVTADDQAVTIGNRSYLKITSDSSANERTITLGNGLQDGQMLVIQCLSDCDDGIFGIDNADGIEIEDVDDNGTVNTDLEVSYEMSHNNTLTLIWNDDQQLWVELSRSENQYSECAWGSGENARRDDKPPSGN